jgi:adenine-specific DNA-methyltransferase
MIKYLGSKRTLLPVILDAVRASGARSVFDVFSGTARVGHALKGADFAVVSNDHNAYAHVLARCYVEADRDAVIDDASKLIDEFNRLPGKAGYFTDTFCVRSRYIQPHNGQRIDAIRDAIAAKSLDPMLEAVMLTSLMEAADRVDSTAGVQMAYLKQWAKRSFKPLEMRMPDVLPGSGCRALGLDAFDACRQVQADLAYVDPPYNQHSYLGNYHVWESLVRWDKPQVYGIACKRVDCRDRRSVFNSRRAFESSLRRLLRSLQVRTIVLSFNNEGYLTREQIESIIHELNPTDVRTVDVDYKRYVGAQIGIYNPQGRKVGKVSHLRNTECVYLVRTSQSPAMEVASTR